MTFRILYSEFWILPIGFCRLDSDDSDDSDDCGDSGDSDNSDDFNNFYNNQAILTFSCL